MSRPLFLLAHGAGAGQSSEFMQRWRASLNELGDVVAFEYDYMERPGRRPPDRMPKLLARHQAELASARATHRGQSTILVGKSMGSRVGCHLSVQLDDPVQGLVCLGYPLKGARSLRDEVLRELRAPVLFVQGTRDPLCPLPLLADVRPTMTARNELHVVQGGDHSLELRVRDRKELAVTPDEVHARAVEAVAGFVASVLT